MKIKTSELTGAALDWAVSAARGDSDIHPYSSSWEDGGPIIERECIDTLCLTESDDGWHASKYTHNKKADAFGPTPLIAAMRCYCASKLGDEVEVPKEKK